MAVAADFSTGIQVVAVEVATVGVGLAGGIGFTGKVWLVDIGWAIPLTLDSALALPFFSALLATKVFLVEEFLSWEGVLVHGCNWSWGYGLGLGPSLPSSSRYVFTFLIKDG